MSILDRVKSVLQRPATVTIRNTTDVDLTIRQPTGAAVTIAPHQTTEVVLVSGMRISVGDDSVRIEEPPFPAAGGMSIN